MHLRLKAALVLAFVATLLTTAIYLNPAKLEDPYHSSYSFLKPCGILISTGYPCPTCYMTRSFSHMMHARPDKAFLAQPFGAILSLMVIYLGYGAIHVLYTGKPWTPFWSKLSFKWIIIIFLAAFVSGWIFKLLYGTFITHEFPLH